MLMTCWTPLPSWHGAPAVRTGAAAGAAAPAGVAAELQPIVSAATATSLISRLIPNPLVARKAEPRDRNPAHASAG